MRCLSFGNVGSRFMVGGLLLLLALVFIGCSDEDSAGENNGVIDVDDSDVVDSDAIDFEDAVDTDDSGDIGEELPPEATSPVIRLWAPEGYTVGSGPLTLRWRASADGVCRFISPMDWVGPGVACTGRDECLGDLDAAHEVSFVPPRNVVAGNYEFGISCDGQPQPELARIKVIVGAPGAEPYYCAGSRPAGGVIRLLEGRVYFDEEGPGTSMDDKVLLTKFGYVFGRDQHVELEEAAPWPKYTDTMRTLSPTRNHYVALQFTVPEDATDGFGEIAFTGAGMEPAEQSGVVSLSVCHGDFGQYSEHQLGEGCITSGSMGAMRMAWGVDASGRGRCALERGRTYYLNIRSDCTDLYCRYTAVNEAEGIY